MQSLLIGFISFLGHFEYDQSKQVRKFEEVCCLLRSLELFKNIQFGMVIERNGMDKSEKLQLWLFRLSCCMHDCAERMCRQDEHSPKQLTVDSLWQLRCCIVQVVRSTLITCWRLYILASCCVSCSVSHCFGTWSRKHNMKLCGAQDCFGMEH